MLRRGATRVADVGGGTGKLARRLAPRVGRVAVADRSADALDVARASLLPSGGDDGEPEERRDGGERFSFHEADLRALPLAAGDFDLVVVGWALSYLKSEHEQWHADGSASGPWRSEVDAALAELERVLAPGGTLVILETQGTATAEPQRAGSHLYAHLRDAGLHERSLRTDYAFPDKRPALHTLEFFFGRKVARRAEAMLAGAAEHGEAVVVPECTAMWWRQKPPAGALAGADARTSARPDG